MHSSNKLLLFCPIKNSNSEQYCTKSYANLFVFKKSKKNTTFYHINMAIDIVIFHNWFFLLLFLLLPMLLLLLYHKRATSSLSSFTLVVHTCLLFLLLFLSLRGCWYATTTINFKKPRYQFNLFRSIGIDSNHSYLFLESVTHCWNKTNGRRRRTSEVNRRRRVRLMLLLYF